MRIQNNITAMNTHRQYTINNDNVAKAAEKLSSGYRINRAGDDAAGLAISEKMRSQIRGLNMATKNSQDAISLVQTAEGALQETHSMLQRMNELAVQAATGTNEEIDRNALAKEFEQLKREINDVAEQTTFNNMKILDGSLSNNAGYVRSAATAGFTVSSSEDTSASAPGLDVTNAATTGVNPGGAGTPGVWTMTIADTTTTTDNSTDVTATVSGLNINNAPVTLTITSAGNGSGSKNTWGALTTAEKNAATITGLPTGFSAQIKSGNTIEIKQTAATPDNGTLPTVTGATVTTSPVKAGGTGTKELTNVTVDVTKLKAGDKFTIGEGTGAVTYVLTDDDNTATGTEKSIQWKDDADKTLAKLLTGINANTPAGVTVAAVGTTGFSVEQQNPAEKGSTTPAYVSTKVDFQPKGGDKVYNNTLEIDAAKLKKGDEISGEINGKKWSITYDPATYDSNKTSSASEQIAKAIAEQVGLTAKGNAITWKGAKSTSSDIKFDSITATDTTKYATNAIRIQVGALEDEQLSIGIEAMNTKGLGLDDMNLDSQNEAGMAITAVRNAVNKVSDQRATLGAMQNRLDHKIANLKVSSENLSAAESRIRDVDMASEMTNFTKNNILSQAATAMLAQANALPQNVLSLLG